LFCFVNSIGIWDYCGNIERGWNCGRNYYHFFKDFFFNRLVTVTTKIWSFNIKGLFGSMVTVAFQNTFHVEMHQNNFFYFLKIIFKISASKQSKI